MKFSQWIGHIVGLLFLAYQVESQAFLIDLVVGPQNFHLNLNNRCVKLKYPSSNDVSTVSETSFFGRRVGNRYFIDTILKKRLLSPEEVFQLSDLNQIIETIVLKKVSERLRNLTSNEGDIFLDENQEMRFAHPVRFMRSIFHSFSWFRLFVNHVQFGGTSFTHPEGFEVQPEDQALLSAVRSVRWTAGAPLSNSAQLVFTSLALPSKNAHPSEIDFRTDSIRLWLLNVGAIEVCFN